MLEEVKENISYNVLNIMTLGNGKGQDNKFKSFLKQTSLAFIKTFCGKWKEETLPKWFFISKKLEKCQNESWQSKFHKFLQTFTRFLHVVFYTLFTRFLHAFYTQFLQVLMFPVPLLKRNLWSYWKWKTFEIKFWPFFMIVYKKNNKWHIEWQCVTTNKNE